MTTPTGSDNGTPRFAALFAALAAVQAELKPIKRTSQSNRGKYADLAAVVEEVLPLLSGAGIAWTAKPKRLKDGRWVLRGKLVHVDTGEREQADWPLAATGGQQQLGAEVTYARRYLLCAMTGAVAAGDDSDADDAGTGEVTQGGGQAWHREMPLDRPSRAVTRTKVTGPGHEQLRDGTVERTPEDRPAHRAKGLAGDEWTDQPPGQLPKPPGGKRGAIHAHFKRLGITDRDVRLGYTAALAGLETLTSTNDLTDSQVQQVLKDLGRCRDEKALRALLDRGDAPQDGDDA